MSEHESHKKSYFMTHDAFVDLANSMIQSGDAKIGMIPGEDFDVIETVYRYHPAIDDVLGREKIADLYANFGFSIIMDMLPRAQKMRSLEKDYARIESSLTSLREEMDAVSKGAALSMLPF